MNVADVIVVGAGIVGAACAHRLAACGLDVVVVDARSGGATAAGMGHLVAMDDDPAECLLSTRSLPQWREWADALPADCAYSRCGTLWIAADEAEAAVAQAKRVRLNDAGVACEWLDGPALAEAEPALRPGLAGALRVPGDAIVYAPAVARWWLRSAARPVALRHAEVAAIDGDTVTLADGRRWSACAVVLAAGLASQRLVPELPLRAKKGQLAITDRYPARVRHQLLELGYVSSVHQSEGASVAFNLQPRPTGQLLIGSSRQVDAADLGVDAALLSRMLRRASHYLPGLGALNAIRTWAGVRPATEDGAPLIGRHPWRRGLWLALGHEGLGVTTAPATAELLAAQITGQPAPFDPALFRPERFARMVQPCPAVAS